MSSWNIQKVEGGWRLPIEQHSVSRCIVDHAFGLEFSEGEQSAVVRIEATFTIFAQGRAHRLAPSAPHELGPAMGLFGQVVRSATSSSQGRLEIEFEDGRMLSVEPDAIYEAWEIYGPGGMRAVCTPGRAVSVWQPKDESAPSNP